MAPVEEKVVVIENVVLLLPRDIGPKEAAKIAGPLGVPWKNPGTGFFERTPGVDVV